MNALDAGVGTHDDVFPVPQPQHRRVVPNTEHDLLPRLQLARRTLDARDDPKLAQIPKLHSLENREAPRTWKTRFVED